MRQLIGFVCDKCKQSFENWFDSTFSGKYEPSPDTTLNYESLVRKSERMPDERSETDCDFE